jgi:hypothetical protein
MSWSRICALTITVTLMLCFITISYAVAGGKTAAAGSDEIKALLLRPNGWMVEWRGNSSGVIDFIFEERGENVVVKIHNAAWNQSCERDVLITSDVIKLDGCNEKGIQLYYDPNDKEYPFKGESPNVNYKLKEK